MALNFRKMPTGGKRKKGDRVMRKTLPMNLQFFAEGGADNGGQDNNAGGTNNNTAGQNAQNGQNSSEIDYNKIQSMIDTATSKKENAVLKSYFQQQGLSEEKISQAIATFKENKAQQNDTAQLQNQVAAANQEAEKVRIELAATQVAMTLGIDSKTLPYVLKMADFSKAKGTDGKISDDNIKAALEQVLKDVPALKPATENNTGFQIGAGQQTGGQSSAGNNVNVPTKRWNRFNN